MLVGDTIVNERVKQLISRALGLFIAVRRCFLLIKIESASNGWKCSSFANSWPKWLRNSQRRCRQHDAAGARCSCILPYTRMRALKRARCIIEMHYPLPPSLPPPPLPSLPRLISLPHFPVFHSLSLSLPSSKRASLIMRKTDSTPDQRIARSIAAKLSGSRWIWKFRGKTDLMDHLILFRESLILALV